MGQYFRSAHPQSDYETKAGKHVRAHQVRGHCVSNPSGRDQIYPDEIHEIADLHISKLSAKLPPADTAFKNDPNQYDQLIVGWTKYWNVIFKPKEQLDPMIVKALIESESSFNATIVRPISLGSRVKVRGLMQLSDETIRILKDESGELNDHYVNISMKDASDPNLNICAGIRWLFQKRQLASYRLKREATWIEAIAAYKSELDSLRKGRPGKDTRRFLEIYEKYTKKAL